MQRKTQKLDFVIASDPIKPRLNIFLLRSKLFAVIGRNLRWTNFEVRRVDVWRHTRKQEHMFECSNIISQKDVTPMTIGSMNCRSVASIMPTTARWVILPSYPYDLEQRDTPGNNRPLVGHLRVCHRASCQMSYSFSHITQTHVVNVGKGCIENVKPRKPAWAYISIGIC